MLNFILHGQQTKDTTFLTFPNMPLPTSIPVHVFLFSSKNFKPDCYPTALHISNLKIGVLSNCGGALDLPSSAQVKELFNKFGFELIVCEFGANRYCIFTYAGDIFLDKHISASKVLQAVTNYLHELISAARPFKNKQYRLTYESESFKSAAADFVEIPVGNSHPGSFSFVRKHHCHEGVDLYVPHHTPVFNMFEGQIVNIEPFTGEHLSSIGLPASPWWHNTFCVMVKTKFGVINYGEIIPDNRLKIGDLLEQGDLLGHVEQVLKKDKGRPQSMLHLERYTSEIKKPSCGWSVNAEPPAGLLNPINLLARLTF